FAPRRAVVHLSGRSTQAGGQLRGGASYVAGQRPHVRARVVVGVGAGEPGDRVGVVVEHRRGHAGQARRDLAQLGRVTAPPSFGEHNAQRAEGAGSGAVPVHERRRVRVQRPHLGGGQRGEDGAAAGGEVGR